MLSHVIVLGLAAAYATRLLRALTLVHALVTSGIKPWSCNVCMAFWTSAALTVISLLHRGTIDALDLLSVPATAGVALALLTWLDGQTPPPPELP